MNDNNDGDNDNNNNNNNNSNTLKIIQTTRPLDVYCNETTFEATIVMPKSFVIDPEFNDLSNENGKARAYCTITQVKYRLYPTYRLLAQDHRLCGVTLAQRVTPKSLTGVDDDMSENDDNSDDETVNNSGTHWSLPPTGLVAKSLAKQFNGGQRYLPENSVLILNIRFPVIKSLRTNEDTYATLVCSLGHNRANRYGGGGSASPMTVARPDGAREPMNSGEIEVSEPDHPDEDLQSDSVPPSRSSDKSGNYLKDEPVVDAESRRESQFSKPLPDDEHYMADAFNLSTSIVWPLRKNYHPKADTSLVRAELGIRLPPAPNATSCAAQEPKSGQPLELRLQQGQNQQISLEDRAGNTVSTYTNMTMTGKTRMAGSSGDTRAPSRLSAVSGPPPPPTDSLEGNQAYSGNHLNMLPSPLTVTISTTPTPTRTQRKHVTLYNETLPSATSTTTKTKDIDNDNRKMTIMTGRPKLAIIRGNSGDYSSGSDIANNVTTANQLKKALSQRENNLSLSLLALVSSFLMILLIFAIIIDLNLCRPVT